MKKRLRCGLRFAKGIMKVTFAVERISQRISNREWILECRSYELCACDVIRILVPITSCGSWCDNNMLWRGIVEQRNRECSWYIA